MPRKLVEVRFQPAFVCYSDDPGAIEKAKESIVRSILDTSTYAGQTPVLSSVVVSAYTGELDDAQIKRLDSRGRLLLGLDNRPAQDIKRVTDG
jgi:hypothetical protein